MSKVKAELASRCELALMGKVIPVYDNSEVQDMTEYIANVLGVTAPKNVISEGVNQYHQNKVKYLVVNKIQDMRCLTYLLESEDEHTPAPFEEDYGSGYPCSYCYVLNFDVEHFSEFGDCFFKKENDGYYHRVS